MIVDTLSHKQIRYLELARRQAQQSEYLFKHGAILVKSGTIVNCAHNKVVYSSFANRFMRKEGYYGTCHAEIGVILGIDKKITNNCDLYVVRLDYLGNLKLSAPCDMCCLAAKFVGIKRVFYSIDNTKMGVLKL